MSRRILMVIAPQDFRDEELLEPRALFQQEGWQVDTASTQTGEATGMLGATENVSLTLDDVKNNTYDAVVVVGGMGSPQYLWNNALLHDILRKHNDNNKVVSSICLSGAVLANAGLLQGKKATVWECDDSLEVFEKGNCTYTAEEVTVDGNFVTANGPEVAEQFGKQVIQKVQSLIPA